MTDKPKHTIEEYLRRNLLHASSAGAHAGAIAAKKRLMTHKRPPKWLLEKLDSIIERAATASKGVAEYRDELQEVAYSYNIAFHEKNK